MQRLKDFAISIIVLAFVAFPSITSSKNQSPGGTPQGSGRPQTKFRKGPHSLPNRYIVVLNNDVADDKSPREERLERVTKIANSHALAHLGKVDYIYETALKGYAIQLPNEAAAVALSRRPEVQWVEEDQRLEPMQAPSSPQSNPPWGLDAIDGNIPSPSPNPTGRTNGTYIFNGTGAGVNAYVLDTGINTAHADFQTGFGTSRAAQAADCIKNVDCRQGPPSSFSDGACLPSGLPNGVNNDCQGHGTFVAAILGGNTYGVAKGVNIKSVKVCVLAAEECPVSAVIQGVNWVTSQHVTDSSVPKVVNMSLGYTDNYPFNPPTPNNASIDLAVSNSINSGVTYVIAAGNFNVDARTVHPAAVPAALTVGSVDSFAVRASSSDWGPGIDLWAPGVFIVSAQAGNGGLFDCAFWNGSNSAECRDSGTSFAAPHVAGAVAIYLQNRTGLSNCAWPIDGPAPPVGANLSTCPDRIARYLKATSIMDRMIAVNGSDSSGNPVTSPNRFLWASNVPTAPNPVESHRFFIWNQYADLLNRDADGGGMQYYVNLIESCTGDQECIKMMRGIVAANFLRSPEFGGRGGYIANLFNIVFGQRPKTPAELSDPAKVERPHYNEFIADLQAIAGSTDAQVDLLKTTLALNWLQRSEVQSILGGLSNQAFVQKLEFTAGVTLTNEAALIASLNNNTQSRGQVLRAVAENSQVTDKFTLQNFVTMQYIGHLRREPENCHGSPDPANCGYIFHYNRFGPGLDPGTVQNLITRGFIESPEYRRRFGP